MTNLCNLVTRVPFQMPGFMVGMQPESIADHEYPNGRVWQKLFEEGVFEKEEHLD